VDLGEAGVELSNDEGKIGFHSFRVNYITLLMESGANPKKAMVLARHSTMDLAMNTYAKAREKRLPEIAAVVGCKVLRQSGDAGDCVKEG